MANIKAGDVVVKKGIGERPMEVMFLDGDDAYCEPIRIDEAAEEDGQLFPLVDLELYRDMRIG